MEPLVTVTEAGTVNAVVLDDERATVTPLAGAACESVTVQVDVPPEFTVVGEHANLVTVAGVTVRDAVVEVPLADAVSTEVWLDVTLAAVAMKLPLAVPAATVMEAGTVTAAVLEEDSVTAEPPVGAAWDSVAVQVDVAPEPIVVGEHCRLLTEIVTGTTVRDAVLEPPFRDAVNVTV